jgi:CheY-like chemotaxis protein
VELAEVQGPLFLVLKCCLDGGFHSPLVTSRLSTKVCKVSIFCSFRCTKIRQSVFPLWEKPLNSHPTSTNKTLQRTVLLCVDDDLSLLECEKDFLETFGYKVLTAPSGSEGLELASLHSIDVVIVDYCMPKMNGQEFAVEMRRLRPQAPIIMLSAVVDVPEPALKLVDAFIVKRNLSSQLLPMIAQLHGRNTDPSASYDA